MKNVILRSPALRDHEESGKRLLLKCRDSSLRSEWQRNNLFYHQVRGRNAGQALAAYGLPWRNLAKAP